MKKSRPKITEVMKKNMLVKCPHCGWHNRVSKTNRAFACKRCRQPVDLDRDYRVDKYY